MYLLSPLLSHGKLFARVGLAGYPSSARIVKAPTTNPGTQHTANVPRRSPHLAFAPVNPCPAIPRRPCLLITGLPAPQKHQRILFWRLERSCRHLSGLSALLRCYRDSTADKALLTLPWACWTVDGDPPTRRTLRQISP
jgi:hypothetical protein